MCSRDSVERMGIVASASTAVMANGIGVSSARVIGGFVAMPRRDGRRGAAGRETSLSGFRVLGVAFVAGMADVAVFAAGLFFVAVIALFAAITHLSVLASGADDDRRHPDIAEAIAGGCAETRSVEHGIAREPCDCG